MGAKFMLKNKEGDIRKQTEKKKKISDDARCKRTRDGGSFILAIQQVHFLRIVRYMIRWSSRQDSGRLSCTVILNCITKTNAWCGVVVRLL